MFGSNHAGALAMAAVLASAMAGCAHEPQHATTPAGACAVAARHAQAEAMARVPFEIVGGRIYVQARVNGQGPFTFAVDTGASGMGRADASLVTALGLNLVGQNQTSDGVSTATVDTVHFNTLQLGDLQRADFDVITRDYSSSLPEQSRIAGIIGRDFFADGLLVIDFPSRVLTFTRTEALSPDQAGALAYERPFRVPVRIGEVNTTGNLDTGAGVTLALPLSLFNEVSAGPIEDAGRARLTNNVIESGRATLNAPVIIGDVAVSNVEVRVADPIPELIVGGQVLQNFVLAFDQRRQLVAICPASG
jgi:predicted aspartyl protease